MLILLTFLLATVCIIGDNLPLITTGDLVNALVDNCTHSLVAVISWLIILNYDLKSPVIINSLCELLLCGFFASVIDVDHFIMAKSFYLKV